MMSYGGQAPKIVNKNIGNSKGISERVTFFRLEQTKSIGVIKVLEIAKKMQKLAKTFVNNKIPISPVKRTHLKYKNCN